jgi:hypothetical protein
MAVLRCGGKGTDRWYFFLAYKSMQSRYMLGSHPARSSFNVLPPSSGIVGFQQFTIHDAARLAWHISRRICCRGQLALPGELFMVKSCKQSSNQFWVHSLPEHSASSTGMGLCRGSRIKARDILISSQNRYNMCGE